MKLGVDSIRAPFDLVWNPDIVLHSNMDGKFDPTIHTVCSNPKAPDLLELFRMLLSVARVMWSGCRLEFFAQNVKLTSSCFRSTGKTVALYFNPTTTTKTKFYSILATRPQSLISTITNEMASGT